MPRLEKDGVWVYAPLGLTYCSACVPGDMPIEEVERIVDGLNPTGLDHGWKVSDDPHFASGHKNPLTCPDDSTKLHRLMVC